MPDPVLAIDIGGTKMALALVDPDGTVRHETLCPTYADQDAEAILDPLAAAIADLLAGTDADRWCIGIGSAGPIDAPRGTITPVNIPAWSDFPIRDRVLDLVHELTGRPAAAALAGDGHCIALGEHWLGAGRDVDTMIGMVVSTGVGAGAVLGNTLFSGETGNAMHIGHTSVNAFGERCVCGCHGCVEMYARGPAMVEAAREQGFTGTDGKQLCDAARAGDEIALAAIDRGMRALAAGIAAAATSLDVRYFVIGGGVALGGDVIFDPLRRHLADFAVLHFVRDLQVVPAALPNAGLLGAAALALSIRGEGPILTANHIASRT